jgi:hypothetical protein
VGLAAAALVCFATACGGEGGSTSGYSGVDRNKYIDQLTAEEKQRLCSWAIPREGGAGDYSCSDGATGNIYTIEECASSMANTKAHCLVSLVESCILSLDGDPCMLKTTAACQSYVQCVKTSTT